MKRLVWIPLLLFSAYCQAADPIFNDWIDNSQPVYPVLKKAAEEAHTQGWAFDRLEEGRPLPQATARILADTLRRDANVDASLKQELVKLLPSEVAQVRDKSFGNIQDAEARLAANEARLQEIQKTMADNNYSPSTPLGLQSTYETRYEPINMTGVATDESSQTFVHLDAAFQGQTGLGTYAFNLDYDSDFADQGGATGLDQGFYAFGGSSIVFLASPFGFNNVQVNLGLTSVNLSKFLFSAPTYPYMSPFYQAGATVPVAFADSPNGERNIQGLYLRKQGMQGLWIFNDFQAVVEPEAEAYDSFNHTHAWDGVVRGDLPSFGWVPFTESTLLYCTYYYYGSESTELDTFNNNTAFYAAPLAVPEQSQNVAVGFESQLEGGGTLIFEGASAQWSKDTTVLYPYQQNSSLTDQAYFATLSKSVGRMIFVLQGSQVGPYFLPGGHGYPTSGDQQYDRTAGLVLDTLEPYDPRNNAIDSSWKTISEDSAWLTNNSRRASIQATWLDSWGSLGGAVASSQQIEASGPLVEASEFFNNSPYNGYTYFQIFYNDYGNYPVTGTQATGESTAEYNYNAPTTSKAYYKGAPVNSTANPVGLVKWDDLEQNAWRNTSQTIWLSQNGVGDDNLRADSIKYFNTVRADLSLELGSIFKSSRHAHLQIFEELRDTAEQMRLALGASPDLLTQDITGLDFIWQFVPTWEMVVTAGYENWTSNMSYYPVQFTDKTVGVGLDSLLTHLVDNLKVNYRLLLMQHEDANFEQKDFSGWKATIGATLVFSN